MAEVCLNLHARSLLFSAACPNIDHNYSTENVLKARRARGQSGTRGLLGLVPALWLWTLVPTYLYLRPHILYYHLLPFSLYVGLINAYSVGQIIVAHLTKSRFAYQNVLLLPLVFGVFDSLGPELARFNLEIGGNKITWPSALGPSYQVPFVFACAGLALGVYGSFVVDVILAICDYLDIWCLTIKHPMETPNESARKAEKRRERSPTVESDAVDGGAEMGKRSTRGKKGVKA